MSSSTKGIVRTNSKDVMHVADIAERTIREFIRKAVPGYNILKRGMTEQEKNDFKMPEVQAKPADNYLTLDFRYEGNPRTLFIFGDTDVDNQKEFPGRSITLSIGDHGIAVELIRAILERLTHLGDCYLVKTTLLDDPAVKVEAPRMTFVAAVQQGLASGLNLRTWRDLYESIQPVFQSPAAFLGFTPEEMQQIEEDRDAVFDILASYKEQHIAAQQPAAMAE